MKFFACLVENSTALNCLLVEISTFLTGGGSANSGLKFYISALK